MCGGKREVWFILVKKYYQTRCEEKEDELRVARKVITEKTQALEFLLADPNPYRVDIRDQSCFGYGNPYVYFTYVDETGKYHFIKRQMLASKLKLLASSKEAAIFKYEATKPATYWILQKAAECFAEIPEALIAL